MTERLQVSPFFVTIIVAKIWVMADTSNTLHWATEINIKESGKDPNQLGLLFVTLSPLIIAITIQLFLHLKTGFSFKQSCLGSMANMVSIGRPTLDQSQNKLVSNLYYRETIVTSIYYLLLPLICLFLKYRSPSENYRTWTSFTALALSVFYVVITQVYTNYFSKTIFLEEVTRNEDSQSMPRDVVTCETATARINGSSCESDQNEADSSITNVEVNSPGMNHLDQPIESHPNSAELGKEMETFHIAEGDLKKINKMPQHRLQKQIKRELKERVIKKDKWVRIFASISTFTFLVTILSFGLLEHSQGKLCVFAIDFIYS